MTGLILPIDKPAGWTSFDVVAKLRRGLGWKKVGHAGTLDPMATGLLIVLCGDCTSRSDEFMELGKRYTGTIRLGITTDTDDIEGQVLTTSPVNWNEELIAEYCASQTGIIEQIPPAVSAIQVNGVRSYKQARKGNPLLLQARPVRIEAITIRALRNPDVEIDVTCGKGTYIRSIARDLGEALECGGTLTSLRRTQIGSYSSSGAWAIADALTRSEFRGDLSA